MLNFAPNPGPANDAASFADVADGVLMLKLSGAVGPDQPINVSAVRRQLVECQPFRHVHLTISSTGGNIKEATEIYSALRDQPVPVSATAIDYCYSAGIYIYLAASLRLATPETHFLIHQASNSRDDVLPEKINASNLQAVADRLRDIDRRFAQLLADRTGHPVDWFLDELSDEDLLDVSGAAGVGLVHGFDSEAVNPQWPDFVRRRPAGVYFPPRMLTENYFAACRCAASLRSREISS